MTEQDRLAPVLDNWCDCRKHGHEYSLVYPKCAFQLDDKLPIVLGHFVLEMLLEQVYGLPGNLADQRILQAWQRNEDLQASLPIKRILQNCMSLNKVGTPGAYKSQLGPGL